MHQHAINLVGLRIDVLEEQDSTLRLDFVLCSQHSAQQRKTATCEMTFHSSRPQRYHIVGGDPLPRNHTGYTLIQRRIIIIRLAQSKLTSNHWSVETHDLALVF